MNIPNCLVFNKVYESSASVFAMNDQLRRFKVKMKEWEGASFVGSELKTNLLKVLFCLYVFMIVVWLKEVLCGIKCP